MDAIHYHVKEDNIVVKKAVYIAIGIRTDGTKDVLGMYIGGNESAKYWLEGFNRQLRKVTKNRTVFPTDDALFKLLFLAMKDITAKWVGKPYNWALIMSQLMIMYPERLKFEDLI